MTNSIEFRTANKGYVTGLAGVCEEDHPIIRRIYATSRTERLDAIFGFNSYFSDIAKMGPLTEEEREQVNKIFRVCGIGGVPGLGLDKIQIPVSRQVEGNITNARVTMVACHESEVIVDMFTDIACRIGAFPALLLDNLRQMGLADSQIARAQEEGYVVVTQLEEDHKNDVIVELTEKFAPLEIAHREFVNQILTELGLDKNKLKTSSII